MEIVQAVGRVMHRPSSGHKSMAALKTIKDRGMELGAFTEKNITRAHRRLVERSIRGMEAPCRCTRFSTDPNRTAKRQSAAWSSSPKGEAQKDDADRCKALAALNMVLASEGWEAFYDENGSGQLRHRWRTASSAYTG